MDMLYWILIGVAIVLFVIFLDTYFNFINVSLRRLKKVKKYLAKAEQYILEFKPEQAKKQYKKVQKHYKNLHPKGKAEVYHRSLRIHQEVNQ